jgi:putative Mn2+ efflux pump MntP
MDHQQEGETRLGFLKDVIGQIWTLLGMFIAWIVLEGTAKTVIGYCIIVSVGIWFITYPLRKDDD